MVVPAASLFEKHNEIESNVEQWVYGTAESIELRMTPVAPCSIREDSLREERFAPDGDEPFLVEKGGMNSPDTHGVMWTIYHIFPGD